MPIFTITTSGHIFQSEHGTRLLFDLGPINPRDKLGKTGVTLHNYASSVFYRTLTLNVEIKDPNGITSRKTLRVNRNSLINYVMAFSDDPTIQLKSDADIISQLNRLAWPNQNLNDNSHVLAIEQDKFGETKLRHAGEHNQRRIDSSHNALGDYVKGKFFSWLYQKTISRLTYFKLRFAFIRTEKKYFDTSEILAKQRFHQALAEVPAYRDFVSHDANFVNQKSRVIADIPVTSKDNYIKPHAQQNWLLHRQGKYPRFNKTDTSTGTTGKPTTWVRGQLEMAAVKKSYQVKIDFQFGKRRLHYINAFALGTWATGLTVYELMRNSGGVYATGPDKDKILDQLELIYHYEQNLVASEVDEFSKQNNIDPTVQDDLTNMLINLLENLLDDKTLVINEYIKNKLKDSFLVKFKSKIIAIAERLNKEKSQILLAGYPPFLKDLVDCAQAKGLSFKKYHAMGVVGGQAISEALREKLVTSGFCKVLSSYGASDLDINIGIESDFEARLRKVIEKNPGLARELYGRNKGLPMIFLYDPLNYYIECSKDNELIFTCNRDDRSSPRVRYDLGDKGRVYAVSDVQALLIKYGIHDLKPAVNLPLLFVWGRESTIIYGGANLAFTELERAITTLDLLTNHCLKYAFYAYHDEEGKEQFEIWIELKAGLLIPEQKVAQHFSEELIACLGQHNQDYAYILAQAESDIALTTVRFFRNGCSLMANADGHHKQVLVHKTLPDGYHYPESKDDCARFTVVNNANFRARVQEAKKLKEVKAERFSQSVLVDYHASSPRLLRGSSNDKIHALSATRSGEFESFQLDESKDNTITRPLLSRN